MRIAQVVGARPQFIKLAPVSAALRRLSAARPAVEEVILHTGQHYDAAMSETFFEELNIPAPAVNLNVGSGLHGAQTARMLEGIERAFQELCPDRVIVYGDTNSTLAGALAAAKLHIPVVHVEAGLRSFNRRMPEELNRIAVDHLSDVLLAPTESAMANLEREGLAARSELVGDVMCDAVLYSRGRALQTSRVLDRVGVRPGEYAIVTIHRAENTDERALAEVLSALDAVAGGGIVLVWPMHPRARNLLGEQLAGLADRGIRVIDPLGYLDMLRMVDGAAVVITDSGGLQKEAFILGIPCVTMRNETEWVESVEAGANIVAGTNATVVLQSVQIALNRRDRQAAFATRARELYGDGTAADRIVRAAVAAR